ncbi:RNA-binding domain-containing protein [Frankia sp. Cj3]|uniref:RNA-binding domain-containing protein n=1 Tax=Frankia sp. Cj3 TaxID=2880976 RepID=UPI00351D4661
MRTDLATALGTQETANLEFKREAKDRNAIREAICALANDLPGLGGGCLIIGVDKSGRPVEQVDTSDQALLGLRAPGNRGRGVAGLGHAPRCVVVGRHPIPGWLPPPPCDARTPAPLLDPRPYCRALLPASVMRGGFWIGLRS